MSKWLVAFVRGLMSFLIAGGGALGAAAASGDDITALQWYIILAAAIVAFARDIQAQLGPSPKE